MRHSAPPRASSDRAALPAAAAEQAAAQTYDIPAGELEAALQQWARQSGQQLLYAGRLVAGKRSDGLSGRYVPGDALQRLLLGSGLKPERLKDRQSTRLNSSH